MLVKLRYGSISEPANRQSMRDQVRKMKELKHAFPLLRRALPKLIAGFLVVILVDGIQLILPMIVRYGIDGIMERSVTSRGLLWISLMILGMAGLVYILKYLWRMLLIANSWWMERELRDTYYRNLLPLSQNFFDHATTGDLMARATNDMNAVRMMFGIGLIALVDALFYSVGSFVFMTSISMRLTLYAIIPLPVLTIYIMFFGRMIHKRFDRVQASFSDMSGMVNESISGIRVVKVFAQERREGERLSEFASRYMKQNISLARLNGLFHPFLYLIMSFSFGIVTIWGGTAVIRKEITIGDYVAFFSYLGQMIWPMIALGFVVNLYQRGTASLKRLNQIIDTDPEITDQHADPSIQTIEGALEIRDLTFRYGENLPAVFDGVSVKLDCGETLAVVGRTGCGKSTLVDLILRIYDPPEGSILIDGQPIHKIPLEVLRNHVVMVPQDIFLFSDTIENNIRFGRPDAPREEVEIVAKMARVHDDILGFKNQYETMVGERGVTLSGGQKQRIAIARAFLCDPSILILDDSLSAVDTNTEKEILEQIVRFRKGKTTIIIAHRISAVQHADQIIVLEQGQIAERGTHPELIKQGNLYQYLWEKQQIEEKLSQNHNEEPGEERQ